MLSFNRIKDNLNKITLNIISAQEIGHVFVELPFIGCLLQCFLHRFPLFHQSLQLQHFCTFSWNLDSIGSFQDIEPFQPRIDHDISHGKLLTQHIGSHNFFLKFNNSRYSLLFYFSLLLLSLALAHTLGRIESANKFACNVLDEPPHL